jgi:hypothetical protein
MNVEVPKVLSLEETKEVASRSLKTALAAKIGQDALPASVVDALDKVAEAKHAEKAAAKKYQKALIEGDGIAISQRQKDDAKTQSGHAFVQLSNVDVARAFAGHVNRQDYIAALAAMNDNLNTALGLNVGQAKSA